MIIVNKAMTGLKYNYKALIYFIIYCILSVAVLAFNVHNNQYSNKRIANTIIREYYDDDRDIFILYNSLKNWDEILANYNDDDDESIINESYKDKIPKDMLYNVRNCNRSNRNFHAIRAANGPGADIYGCVSNTSKDSNVNNEAIFWFLGKVAHVSDVTIEQCIARQWPLIQQHAGNLRPLDLFPAVSNECLDIWYAPIDTELDVAYNRPYIKFQKMMYPNNNIPAGAVNNIKTNLIGFQGEVYEKGEEGFRTWRNIIDGTPSRPEITSSPMNQQQQETQDNEEVKYVAPTDAEMEQLEKALEGKDLNELYEEQERRRREGLL